MKRVTVTAMRKETFEVRRAASTRAVGVVVVIAAFAACGCAASAANAPTGKTITRLPYVGVKGPWLAWNKKTCRFQNAKHHPATYSAVLRKVTRPTKSVYTTFSTTLAVAKVINDAVNGAAKKAGVKQIMLSNEFPSTTLPIQVATQAAAIKPNVVISTNIQPALYPHIQRTYEGACVPMINVFDLPGVPHPAPAIQASYTGQGAEMAKAAVKIINQRGWPASDTWVVVCGDSKIGSTPGSIRDVVTTFESKVAAALKVPSDHLSPVLECNVGDPQGPRTAVTDWLTAHPQAKYVVGAEWVDSTVMGMVQALRDKGFTSNALVATGDATDEILKVIANNDPILQVDTDKRFGLWGTFLVSMAEDVAAGRPVPAYVDPGTVAVTPANAAKVLAARSAGK